MMCRVTDVGRHGNRPCAVRRLAKRVLEPIRPASGEPNGVALREQSQSDGPADPAARSGYERNPVWCLHVANGNMAAKPFAPSPKLRTRPPMQILVTGAAGFLGRRLIEALLAEPDGLPHISRIVAADVTRCPIDDRRIAHRQGTMTEVDFVHSIAEPDIDVVYHLAAVLSGQSEAEFDTGMQVNVDATRTLLEACRGRPRPPRVVFASTVAVFGGELPATVSEDAVVRPQSSYGTEKAIGELLVSEYSRRGFIDGIACRVATVSGSVRPGLSRPIWSTPPECPQRSSNANEC